MSDTVILVLEIIGTVAFAISGAMVAIRKKMDIFGVCILGLVTATGGGVIRDLILGVTPPATFRNPIYAVTALIVSVTVFIPAVRKLVLKTETLYTVLLLVMDSLGLAIFTVVGIRAAMRAVSEPSVFLPLFVGVLSGVGGGIMRDVMAGDKPYVLVKHFYATASLIGAAVCVLLWKVQGEILSIAFGAIVITVLRLLAAHYRWHLPRAVPDEELK